MGAFAAAFGIAVGKADVVELAGAGVGVVASVTGTSQFFVGGAAGVAAASVSDVVDPVHSVASLESLMLEESSLPWSQGGGSDDAAGGFDTGGGFAAAFFAGGAVVFPFGLGAVASSSRTGCALW